MMQFIENMERRNVDELIIIDVNATLEKRKPSYADINLFTRNLFCPISYGGGITHLDDIKRLIQDCGIDKVGIKSKFSLIYSAARKFGSQSVIYAADFNNKNIEYIPKKLNWKNWLKTIQNEGAGEILLTDMNKNGLSQGYNYKLIKEASKMVSIPIIANGGCGNSIHMVEAIKNGASAVAASTMFLFSDTTPSMCARILNNHGVPVRLDGQHRPTEALGRAPLEAAL
jgi:imidazole glycerol-phosphate synthase subunit HisF